MRLFIIIITMLISGFQLSFKSKEETFSKNLAQKQKEIHYKKFKGKITRINLDTYQFGSNQFLKIVDSDSVFDILFERGIIYPEIFGMTSLEIRNLEEIEQESSQTNQRSFQLLIFQAGIVNPNVYRFTLSNLRNNSNQDLVKFLRKAKVVKVEDGGVLI